MKKAIINSIYLPITLSSNKYVDIVQNSMKEVGITISGLKECWSPKKLKNIDVKIKFQKPYFKVLTIFTI